MREKGFKVLVSKTGFKEFVICFETQLVGAIDVK
jgi:hypothetical protein